MLRRLTGLALAGATLLAAPAGAHAADWPTFGGDSARSGVFAGATGITAANLGSLRAQQVALPAAADSAPIYLHAVAVAGGLHDVFVVTTAYGRTLTVDAATGAVLWRFDPPGVASWEGGKQITEATPVADPDRRSVYAAAPDGRIHKLALADGSEAHNGAWPVAMTRDPAHEKIGAALNLAGRYVYAATTSYADGRPYQGHLVAIDRGDGTPARVFNVLCGGRPELLDPARCGRSGGSIWGRAGVVVEPGGSRLLVATANGVRRGSTDWGESVLELTPGASRVVRSWTPGNHVKLDAVDLDLGSTEPAPIRYRRRLLALQGSKDGTLRLLDVARLGRGRSGGVLQTFATPSRASMRTTPAVWGRTVLVATNAGTVAYRLAGGAKPRLKTLWRFGRPGTSPLVAGGLVYSFDQLNGALNVLDPARGRLLRSFPLPRGHWNSPVVADGRIAIGSGNANDHERTGTLTILRAP